MSVETARLKRNAAGIYEIHWSEKGVGRHYSKRVSTRTPNSVEAKVILSQFIAGYRHIDETLIEPTVAELVARYKSALESKRVGQTQHICLTHIENHLGDLRVTDINDKRLLDYRKSRQVADGTLRRELGVLRAVFGYAVKHKMIKTDVVPYVELPRASAPRENFLNDEEERAFFTAVMAHSDGKPRLTRLSRFVAIALNTAARKEAILGLTWSQVDLVSGTINFEQAGRQQHNKRRSLVHISKRLLPVLQRAFNEKTTDYVLDNPGSIRKSYASWIEKTEWAHITPHDLRRTWATLAAQAGVPLVAVAEVLGDSVEIVVKHYAKYVPGAAKAAVDARP